MAAAAPALSPPGFDDDEDSDFDDESALVFAPSDFDDGSDFDESPEPALAAAPSVDPAPALSPAFSFAFSRSSSFLVAAGRLSVR